MAPRFKYPPRLRDRVVDHLRDTRGFMLAEQLLSVIFIGLLCIAVAAGLQAAMNAYANITVQNRADALLAQTVEVVSDELTYALSVEDGGDFPYFVSASLRETVAFYSPEKGTTDRGIMLAASQPKLLVAAQGGLVPSLTELTYDETTNKWSYHVQIASGSKVLAEADMTVKRIGS